MAEPSPQPTRQPAHPILTDEQITIYRRPPIVERVITAYAPMDKEEYAAKADTWKSQAIQAFPFFNPTVEWDINIEEKDGVPVVAESGPTMRIHHWFFEHLKKERRGFVHQSDRDKEGRAKFGINLLRHGDKVYRFKDIEAKFREWLPRWADHFGIKSFSGVSLDYVNALNEQTVPEFCRGGRLHIGEVFRLFSNIPGPHVTLIPPYDCRVNMLIDEKMPITGQIVVRSAETEGLRINMQMRSLSSQEKSITADEVLAEVLALHRCMVTYFEASFTDAARKSFDPIK